MPCVDRLARRRRGFIGDLTGRVIGIRLRAEPNHRVIHFRLALDVRNEPRASPDEHDEKSRRERIERAGVPDAPRAGDTANDGDDVVRSEARRLVDQQQTSDVSPSCLHRSEPGRL